MRYPIDGFSINACRDYLKSKEEHRLAILRATWIRPEDLHYYDVYFDTVKLATRMHPAPYMVLDAYAHRHYEGNLPDLMEPGLGSILSPHILDNTRFSSDWFEKVLYCNKNCEKCSICQDEWHKIFV